MTRSGKKYSMQSKKFLH